MKLDDLIKLINNFDFNNKQQCCIDSSTQYYEDEYEAARNVI